MWIMVRDSDRAEQKTLYDSAKNNQPFNILQRNNPYLFWEPHKTHKFILLYVNIKV